MSYRFTASGAWSDAGFVCGPSGYFTAGLGCLRACTMRPGAGARAVPSAPWFALIGSIGGDRSTAFEVGPGCDYRAVRDGELMCCANDAPWLRWNNRGAVDLTVTRLG